MAFSSTTRILCTLVTGLISTAFVAAAEPGEHWAFKPVLRPPLPKVKNAEWTRNAIDRFILSRLEAEKLGPAPEADRLTLVRRLYFNLLGLPPAPEEIAAFLADDSALAYEKLVEHLLASPHYGERLARHWL